MSREPDPAGQRFAVLGYGRFGQALTGLLQQAGHRVTVHDPDADVPQEFACASAEAAIRNAHWVVLAMPVAHMTEVLRTLRPRLRRGQIVLDVGSVKTGPCAAMDAVLGADIAHVGTHPLFGPLSLARDERPRRVVICAAQAHPQAAEQTRQLFRQLDCEVLDQTPEAHDRSMAMTHVLAFFMAKGLIDIGADEGMPMAPPSFQGMKNMLAAVRGDAGHLFATIQRENPFADEARQRLLTALQHIHRQLLDEGTTTDLNIPATDP